MILLKNKTLILYFKNISNFRFLYEKFCFFNKD
jgi:hypothetical protein